VLIVLFGCGRVGSLSESLDFPRQRPEFGRHLVRVSPEPVEAFFDALNLGGAFFAVAAERASHLWIRLRLHTCKRIPLGSWWLFKIAQPVDGPLPGKSEGY
jgi:hypothetical protein